MADAQPLGDEEFAGCLAGVIAPDAVGLVLAVSGGPDSMALLHLAARQRPYLPPLTVGTVDHRLRRDLGEDAARVMEAAQALGLPCRVLPWEGPKPSSGVQEAARTARYALLLKLCAGVGADHLVTAHTLDDQAETVLLRLLRGSGLTGLGAMAGATRRGRVTLARPLLGIGKARLIATCAALGITVHHDPANTDVRFARARLRRLLPLLAEEGFGAPALARLAERLGRADEALQVAAEAAFDGCTLPPGQDGEIRLDARRLVGAPREIVIRVLAGAVTRAGGRVGRLDRLERLAGQLCARTAVRQTLTATLGGTVLRLSREGAVACAAEQPRRRGTGSPRPVAEPAGSFTWQG